MGIRDAWMWLPTAQGTGDRQSAGGLSQPLNSAGPPPRPHRPQTSQIYRANRSAPLAAGSKGLRKQRWTRRGLWP